MHLAGKWGSTCSGARINARFGKRVSATPVYGLSVRPGGGVLSNCPAFFPLNGA